MRLAPLYEQDREKAIQQGEAIGIQKGRIEGIQQGEANLVLRLLKRRFGELQIGRASCRERVCLYV